MRHDFLLRGGSAMGTSRRFVRPEWLALASSGILLASAVQAGGPPLLAGPSVLRVSETAQVSGLNLPAGASVTVFLTAPDGAKAGFGKMVGADGSMSYSFVGQRPGAYVVKVTDSGGRTLATTRVNFAQ
jgi:hypothetical protein